VVYIGLFFLSLALTYIIKVYALKKAILDLPNERSSHSIPTPRGGGLAIIITFYVGLFLFKDEIPLNLFLALLAVFPIVLVSLIDDIKTLSSKIRLVVQMFSALLALYLLGGVNSINFISVELSGWWLNVVAFVLILWLTNLYNFLDGIDGYAATQTVMLGLGISLLLSNPLGDLLIIATLGFLLFNWHKASIFMGDVGSASLGFIIAILLFSETSSGKSYFWLIALSLFWFDATVTLIRRYLNQEVLTKAHKKHAYQRLVQSGWSHAQVTLGLLFFNAFFLLLMYFYDWRIIFFVNLFFLVLIYLWIEGRKSFYDV